MECKIDTLTCQPTSIKPIDNNQRFYFVAEDDVRRSEDDEGMVVVDEEDLKGPGAIAEYEIEERKRSTIKGTLSGEDIGEVKWMLVLHHDSDTGTFTVEDDEVAASPIVHELNFKIALLTNEDKSLLPAGENLNGSDVAVRVSDARKVAGYLHELRDHHREGFEL